MAEDKEYTSAPTVKQFKKDHPQLVGKGKRIILCDHLKNETMSLIALNLWIGDYSRMLLCPICSRLYKQTLWEHMVKETFVIMDTMKKVEYQSWIEGAGK